MSAPFLTLKPSDFISSKPNFSFSVHAPELFAHSHLMDLTSQDKLYLEKSLVETQRVIDITRNLKNYFPSEKRPMIVANIGGFSMDEPIEKDKKYIFYEEFERSLAKLEPYHICQ